MSVETGGAHKVSQVRKRRSLRWGGVSGEACGREEDGGASMHMGCGR